MNLTDIINNGRAPSANDMNGNDNIAIGNVIITFDITKTHCFPGTLHVCNPYTHPATKYLNDSRLVRFHILTCIEAAGFNKVVENVRIT